MFLVPLHGLGGAKDLPIPLGLAVSGATAALIVSFCVLALAWRTPRYQDVRPGRPAPAWLSDLVASPGFQWTVRLLGLLFFGYLVWALIWGPDLVNNPALGTFYVLITGCRWIDIPREYGDDSTANRRLRRWEKLGVWERIMDALIDEGYGKGDIKIDEISIDSSTVAARKGGSSSAMMVTTGRKGRRYTSV